MSQSIESQIQCPFFVSEVRNFLCCEGYIEGTCMTTKFCNRYTAVQYMYDHCFHKSGGNCPMAQNLFEKYRQIEEEEERKEREWYEKMRKKNDLQIFSDSRHLSTQKTICKVRLRRPFSDTPSPRELYLMFDGT